MIFMSGDRKNKLNRRKFLTASTGLASLLILDISTAKRLLAEMPEEYANRVGILVNPSQCIGCMACVEACKNVHGGKTGTLYTDVKEIKRYNLNVPILCMHCEDPPCANVCLTGALTKLRNGPVALDQSKCIGCTLCTGACPFNRIQYDQSQRVAFKCDMCQERVSKGLVPACVEACPVSPKARLFGTYKEVLDEGVKNAEKIDGLLVFPRETSTLYVVKKEWLEELSNPPIKLSDKYPQEARLMANISKYSEWGLVPVALGVIGYALMWRKEKFR